MAFPRTFYKKTKNISVRRTATPTGVLSTPTDLISSPRPWLTVEEKLATEEVQKKTLIFADHLFHRRDREEQKLIMKRLRSAKNEGFCVLVQWPDSQLKEWDGRSVPRNYCLDLNQYNPEVMSGRAWTERQLSAENIVVLDYWGMNELLGQARHTLNGASFVEHPGDFRKLVSSATESGFQIKFPRQPEGCAREFFKQIAESKNSLPVHQFKEFEFVESKTTLDDVAVLYKIMPTIEKLKLTYAGDQDRIDLERFVKGIPPEALQQLKELHFCGSVPLHPDFTLDDVMGLLKLLPSLERVLLALSGNFVSSVFFRGLKVNAAGQIKELHFEKPVRFGGEDLVALFKAMPNLEVLGPLLINDMQAVAHASIHMPHLKKIELWTGETALADLYCWQAIAPAARISIRLADIEEFTQKQRPLLSFKEITLRFPRDQARFVQLLKTMPRLERIKILGNVVGSFSFFDSIDFQQLKAIDVRRTGMDKKDVVSILKAAPFLEEIDFSYCDIPNITSVFKVMSIQENLRNLKVIKVSSIEEVFAENRRQLYASLFNSQLTAIFEVSPALRELEISQPRYRVPGADPYPCAPLFRTFEMLNPRQFAHLRILKITGLRKGITPLTVPGIRALLAAAPCLEEISFDGSRVTIVLAQTPGTEWVRPLERHERVRLMEIGFPQETVDSASLSLEQKGSVHAPAVEQYGMSEIQSFTQDHFDTQCDPQKKLNFIEYFPGVAPHSYRHRVWSPHLDTCEGPGDFKPADFKAIAIDEMEETERRHYICHPGRRQTKVEEGAVILLPSLDAEERLLNLRVLDANGRLMDPQKIKLEYSHSTQFYRLVLPEAGKYHLRFEVAVPAPGFAQERPAPPVVIDDMVRKYNAYQIGENAPNRTFTTLREFAKYIQENATGSCWQRCVAAYEELEAKEEFTGKVRIVVNAVHAFLEVRTKGETDPIERWYPFDLGGYPAKLERLSETTETAPPRRPLPESALSFPMTEKPMTKLLEQKKPGLVLSPSSIASQVFYATLHQSSSSGDVFIAHMPESLSVSAPGMTEAGEVKEAYTDLKRWLGAHACKAGTIVVDIREFNATELSQLNDFLDGNIEKQKLPAHIRVILLDDPGRGYYGPDFRRRVPYKSTAISTTSAVLLPTKPPLLEKEEKSIVEIDLYHSHYWQLNLLGNWQIKEEKEGGALSFQWKRGSLLQALASEKKHIIFKNPPLDDSRFTSFIGELQGLRQLHWADQTQTVPGDVRFYQTTGYDWQLLRQGARLLSLNSESPTGMPVLSDANIISFINDPRYGFSAKTNQMESKDSYLTVCQQQGKTLDLVCSPGLSSGSLAQLMAAAQHRGVPVRIFTPDASQIPEGSPLLDLFSGHRAEEKESATWVSPSLCFQLVDDVYFYARRALADSKPPATCFDLSALEATELGRFPVMDKALQEEFLKTGKLKMQAPFSAIIEKLKKGETVILYGKIPPHLYEPLTAMLLGSVEGVPLTGKLLVIVPPEEARVVKAMSGQSLQPMFASHADKIELLQEMYPVESKEFKIGPEKSHFAALERSCLKCHLETGLQSLVSAETQTLSDEKRAHEVDAVRLHNTEHALALNPWVMIEGATGIGKTYFLETVLPASKKETPVADFKTWLTTKPAEGKHLTLVMDEASFLSQLSGEGENFLERFKGLQGKPPGFLWKGVYYPLTAQHKVIFTFNPATYGAGRSTRGFLTEHALPLTFHRLPDYYVRARMIAPLFKAALPEPFAQHPDWLSDPLIHVYRWITENNPQASLITPREIKAMVLLICSQVKKDRLQSSPDRLEILAAEAAYFVGRQTLMDSPQLLAQFDAHFKPTKSILNRKRVPSIYEDRREAYLAVMHLLDMRNYLLESKDSLTDMGLGGIVLEGGAGIGKSYFVDAMTTDLEKRGEKVYRISATTPYSEKERILRQAFAEGAIVVADEMNTSLWPNKLLNNFLMGLDENNKPAKKPGFMLIATQNPPSFLGRSEEDPALRRRLIKLKLDWAVRKEIEKTMSPSEVSGTLFSTTTPVKATPTLMRIPDNEQEKQLQESREKKGQAPTGT